MENLRLLLYLPFVGPQFEISQSVLLSGPYHRNSKKVVAYQELSENTLSALPCGDFPNRSLEVWRLFGVPGRRPQETCSGFFRDVGAKGHGGHPQGRHG